MSRASLLSPFHCTYEYNRIQQSSDSSYLDMFAPHHLSILLDVSTVCTNNLVLGFFRKHSEASLISILGSF